MKKLFAILTAALIAGVVYSQSSSSTSLSSLKKIGSSVVAVFKDGSSARLQVVNDDFLSAYPKYGDWTLVQNKTTGGDCYFDVLPLLQSSRSSVKVMCSIYNHVTSARACEILYMKNHGSTISSTVIFRNTDQNNNGYCNPETTTSGGTLCGVNPAAGICKMWVQAL